MSKAFRTHGACVLSAVIFLAPIYNGATAADMAMPPPMVPTQDNQMMEFGSGWYLRGDVGITGETSQPLFGSKRTFDSSSFPNNWTLGGGFGYKYNDWFRTDVTADYRGERNFIGTTQTGVQCQVGWEKIAAGTAADGTALWWKNPKYDTFGCFDKVRTRISNVDVFFNAYLDLYNFYGFTPYVGGGIGLNVLYQKYQRSWFLGTSQQPYNATFSDPFTGTTETRYWDSSTSQSRVNFAWNLTGGVSYSFTNNTLVDVAYRYSDLGKTFDGSKMRTNEVRIGLRYTPDLW